MAFYGTTVTIYDAAVDSLFLPGGDVYSWMATTGRLHENLARISSPARTGVVRASHGFEMGRGVYGLRGVEWIVYNTAAHAIYPHEGTTGPITPKTAKALRLSPRPPMYPDVILKRAVRGQRAQKWIENAAYAAIAIRT